MTKRKRDEVEYDFTFTHNKSKRQKLSIYEIKNDLSLTNSQTKNQRFSTQNNYRTSSSGTLFGYSTGNHESAVTTDTYNYLRKARDNLDGTTTLANAKSPSYFAKFSGITVPTETLSMVLELADSFRTDTAQTLLSGKNGKAAGHSGSNVATHGQKDAHDFIRASTMRLVMTDPKEAGFSRKSFAAIFAANTVTQIAPGEVARRDLDTANLKAARIKPEYEKIRNSAKRRVGRLFGILSPDEQAFVNKHSSEYMNSIGDPNRRIDSATSPIRKVLNVDNKVSGGGYDREYKNTLVTKTPPSNVFLWGFYATEPFRAPRRTFLEQ
ncbi:MAG: hypothetical protein SFT93_02865 [Rickettsiaceae bacterium]|nr:hypothetical protein [Rickettsiaceae bacterium]